MTHDSNDTLDPKKLSWIIFEEAAFLCEKIVVDTIDKEFI